MTTLAGTNSAGRAKVPSGRNRKTPHPGRVEHDLLSRKPTGRLFDSDTRRRDLLRREQQLPQCNYGENGEQGRRTIVF